MRLHHVHRGGGEPLVLLHGIGDSCATWSRVTGRLARSHEVWAVDLPGFGASPPLPSTPTVTALADAITAFMARQGHERFHAAGNSLGGGISIELALRGTALSACALSPIGFMSGWERAWSAASLRLTRDATRAGLPLLTRLARSPALRRATLWQMVFHGERVPPDELAVRFAALARAPGFDGALRHAVLAWEAPDRPRLPVPVTIAWGVHDRLLLYRPQHARARDRFADARHVDIPDAGHVPQADVPADIARIILETTAQASTKSNRPARRPEEVPSAISSAGS